MATKMKSEYKSRGLCDLQWHEFSTKFREVGQLVHTLETHTHNVVPS